MTWQQLTLRMPNSKSCQSKFAEGENIFIALVSSLKYCKTLKATTWNNKGQIKTLVLPYKYFKIMFIEDDVNCTSLSNSEGKAKQMKSFLTNFRKLLVKSFIL